MPSPSTVPPAATIEPPTYVIVPAALGPGREGKGLQVIETGSNICSVGDVVLLNPPPTTALPLGKAVLSGVQRRDSMDGSRRQAVPP
jgi:hypothetical protein